MKKLIVIFKKIHLWLGILTGPFVFCIALTGALYAFQEEIQNFTQPFRYYNKDNRNVLSPSNLIAIAQSNVPNKKVHSIVIFSDNHSAKIIFYSFDEYYEVTYINPQSGEILAHENQETGVFPFILEGHLYLWLPPDIGKPIVAFFTITFLINLLIGLFLWWPKNKNYSQRLKFRLTGSWKRINFDLHSVLGFYIIGFSIVFALTGLVWSLDSFRNLYYRFFSGKEYVEYYEPLSNDKSGNVSKQLNVLFNKLVSENQGFHYVELHIPETEYSSLAANVNTETNTYWKTDYYYFDQASLEELSVNHYWDKLENAGFGEILLRVNYDVHTGAILGITGKIMAFVISLLIASLPVTGILFYFGRKKILKK